MKVYQLLDMKIQDLFEKMTSSPGSWSVVGELTNGRLPEGIPEIINGTFRAGGKELVSMVGGPKIVKGQFNVRDNELSSFEGAPEQIQSIANFSNNKFTSLKDIHKHIKKAAALNFYDNDIESHVLGVLLIDGLEDIGISQLEISIILKKYLPNTRGMAAVVECQSELLDAGFEDFAQL